MSPNQKQQVYSCRKTSRSDNLFKILLSYQLCNKNISFLTKCKVKVIPVHFSTRVFRIFNKQLIYIVYQDNIVNIDGVIVTCPSTTVPVFLSQNRKLDLLFFQLFSLLMLLKYHLQKNIKVILLLFATNYRKDHKTIKYIVVFVSVARYVVHTDFCSGLGSSRINPVGLCYQDKERLGDFSHTTSPDTVCLFLENTNSIFRLNKLLLMFLFCKLYFHMFGNEVIQR